MSGFHEGLKNFLTPIRVFSLIAIILGLVDGFNLHVPNNLYEIVINALVRCIIFFVGFFGLFKNGQEKRIRAITVSAVFIYYGIISLFEYFESGISYYISSMMISLIVGAWLMLWGEAYE
jgi:hypothetical protein